MKKYINCLLIVFLLLIGVNKVDALSVSKNDLTIEKGKNETIELYANVEENVTSINFTLVFSTYDVPAYFTVNSAYTDTNPNGIAHNIVFPEPESGEILLGTISINVKNNPTVTSGAVNIHTGSAKNENGESINLNIQNLNVTIGTPQEVEPVENNDDNTENNDNEEPKDDKKDTNLLEKIESEIVKITLKENVFEYTVNIDKEIEELDLKPIAKDESSKIDLTSQKISELENNQIVITVKNGDTEQKYTIKVSEKKEVEKPTIDNEEFKTDNSHKTKWVIVIIGFGVLFVIGLALSKKK